MSEKIDGKIYKFFADIVFKKTGIYYPERDYYRLDSRLEKMRKQFKFETIEDLYKKCSSLMTIDMEMYLIDICTNNETYFFRDQKPFDALTKEIIPDVMSEQQNIKIWSCASSTGQEPLSICMSIAEAGINKPYLLDASDISEQALAKAKSGIYSGLDVQRGLPIQLLVKYFEQEKEGFWKAKNEIHSRINYFKFNLFTGHFKPNYYDIIFCRNVLIYQNQENKQLILQSLFSSLKDGGVIIMGAGESLIGIDSQLQQLNLKSGIVFQKKISKQNVA